MNEALIIEKIENLKDFVDLRFIENEKFVGEKFKNNEDAHTKVNKHLENLNGQTSKNTAFRNRGAVYVAIFAFIVPTVITYLLNS